MRVLFDTNVVLDFLQEREPFIKDAAKLFELIDANRYHVLDSTTSTQPKERV
jgi:predicted nucleic acid-binding protein